MEYLYKVKLFLTFLSHCFNQNKPHDICILTNEKHTCTSISDSAFQSVSYVSLSQREGFEEEE